MAESTAIQGHGIMYWEDMGKTSPMIMEKVAEPLHGK